MHRLGGRQRYRCGVYGNDIPRSAFSWNVRLRVSIDRRRRICLSSIRKGELNVWELMVFTVSRMWEKENINRPWHPHCCYGCQGLFIIVNRDDYFVAKYIFCYWQKVWQYQIVPLFSTLHTNPLSFGVVQQSVVQFGIVIPFVTQNGKSLCKFPQPEGAAGYGYVQSLLYCC